MNHCFQICAALALSLGACSDANQPSSHKHTAEKPRSVVLANVVPLTVDGMAQEARFGQPMGLAFDSKGNLYVADAKDQVIRMITPAREVKTFAGLAGRPGHSDGQGSNARFASPYGIVIDASDNLFVTDAYNETIRMITPSATVTTIAGVDGQSGGDDGDRAHAMFDYPRGIAIDADGNLYVVARNAVRQIVASGDVRTIAGNRRIIPMEQESYGDGIGQLARFRLPAGVTLDRDSNIYIADTNNSVVRKIDALGWVTTIAGAPGVRGHADGSRAQARFDHPSALVVDSNGDIFVAACGKTTIRRITVDGATVSMGPMGCAHGIAIGPDGAIYLSNAGTGPESHVPGSIVRVTRSGDAMTYAGPDAKWPDAYVSEVR